MREDLLAAIERAVEESVARAFARERALGRGIRWVDTAAMAAEARMTEKQFRNLTRSRALRALSRRDELGHRWWPVSLVLEWIHRSAPPKGENSNGDHPGADE